MTRYLGDILHAAMLRRAAAEAAVCATCGGSGYVERQLDRWYTALVGGPCPDCTREATP